MAVVYRRLRILTPNIGAYYGVVDEEYRPHELASRWLEVRFFGRAQAETTSAQYAGSIALFLTWAHQSGRDLERAARHLHLFAAYLATEPQRSGRNAGSPRTAGRANRILVAVREFYRFAITEGALPARQTERDTERHNTMSDQHADRREQETDEDTIAQVIEMLKILDNTSLNEMSPFFYQHWFEQLNMSIRDLLRILGHETAL